MAPLRPVKKDGASEQRADGILASARTAVKALKSRDGVQSELRQELENHVKRSFPVPISTAIANRLSEFDHLGCNLWNAATNLLREDEQQQASDDSRERHRGPLQTILRTFAFLLLDTAHHATARRSKDMDQQIRNFRIGLKACRFCLDQNELQLAVKLLERCAEHVNTVETESPLVRMHNDHDEANHRETKLAGMVSEYYLLRMTHAFKADRIDLADHFFDKLSISGVAQPIIAELTAQLCFDAGKTLVKRGSVDLSIKWLDRALSALDGCGVEDLSMDSSELRLAITSTLVAALLSGTSADGVTRARQIVEDLDTVHSLGNRMAVQLLHLKVLFGTQPLDNSAVSVVLSRLLRTAVLSERTFKMIMQAIHRAGKGSPEIAFGALEQLITARLVPDMSATDDADEPVQAWTEKACVTLTLLTTKNVALGFQPAKERLQRAFTSVASRAGGGFSAKATHAMQTLIWKTMTNMTPADAEHWCGLLRHPLFNGAGHINKARIGRQADRRLEITKTLLTFSRRAMNLAITQGDFEAARLAYFEMPPSAQNESITRYIAFKLAILTNDYDFASESLEVVLKHADRDATFLYACALEAQQSQMRHIAIAALQAILDKQPPGIHLPSLLRCTARLLISELDSPSSSLDDAAQETVRVFESAAADLAALKQDSNEHSRTELQWWSKNAYNITLKLCGQVHPGYLVRLLQVCVKFIDACPRDGGSMHDDDLNHRQALCHFLAATALVVLGRSNEEGSEYSLQCYLHARQEIAAFKSVPSKQNQADHNVDHAPRLFELQKFDLESILNLQQWDEVSAAFQTCLEVEQVDSWDTLADIVLIIHQKIGSSGLSDEANSRMMELLDRIINETWQKQKDIVKASRWLRLSFALDLADGDGSFALKLLGQATRMAKRQQSKALEAFPETELQWLATTAFNKAVDLLSTGANESCMEWIQAALDLAYYAGDNGALHANLTAKKEMAAQRMREVVV